MHPVIEKTFGGLSLHYYLRQFVFGAAIGALMIFMKLHERQGFQLGFLTVAVVCTVLYPYSRFVYESIVKFIMGENIFFVNAFIMLFVKLITMAVCWAFAIFIAPIGLIYLYFHHSSKRVEI